MAIVVNSPIQGQNRQIPQDKLPARNALKPVMSPNRPQHFSQLISAESEPKIN
ncbi:unnamed protein product [Wuchereria bancrofti]|uniref:Uncharacterized protein n=1 Tax=Wuchereria bancrofti TaxID=6293 RepID=A0A3P7GIH9_WUCBA|nr:unnamed protein product [Wuchereria bancrofti]